MPVDVKVPELGESISEGTIVAWLVQVGDRVAVDQPLLELETDKVTAELPAPVSGVITERLFAEGADVEVGAIVARIEAGDAPAATPAAPAAATPAPAPPARPAPAAEAPKPAPAARAGVAMPAARAVLGEAGLDPAQVEGTGRDGRILKEDAVRAASAPASQKAPAPPAAGERGERRVRMTRMRKTIARALKETQETAAILTTFNEVDMAPVMELRARYKDDFERVHGVKLGFMSFFVKASVEALKALPAVNAVIDGDDIRYRDYYDIGIAVSSDRGLVVPVVRDADRLSFSEIEKSMADLAKAARTGALTLDQLQGGTFSITNGGVFGSMLSTPILNQGQSAILGMHNIVRRPVAVGDEVQIRPIMYVALSYDHRIVDGREAVTFLVKVKQILEDPARLLLEV